MVTNNNRIIEGRACGLHAPQRGTMRAVRETVIKRLLTQQQWRTIEKLLEQSNGNIDHALSLSKERNQYDRSIGDDLGNFGRCSPNEVSFTVRGSAPSNDVQVWLPDSSITNAPDLTISWRTVFQYVAEHSDRDITRQLRMRLQLR